MLIIALLAATLLTLIALVWLWPLPVGTRSLLFGAHQFFLHPLFLAVAWIQLYGWPRDPRIWCAFVVHDWGYWGKEAMDDESGQRHPELGGRIMGRLFGPAWGDFTRLHSRYYAKIEGREPSPLCAADKLVLLVTPRWLYLPLVQLSGEVAEYRAMYAAYRGIPAVSTREWYAGLCQEWADEVARLAPLTAWAIAHRRRRRLGEGGSYAAEQAARHGGEA